MKIFRSINYLLIAVLMLFIVSCANGTAPLQLPSPGIYDGTIGKKQLILVISSTSNNKVSGYYIYNGKNAVEKSHPLTIEQSQQQVHLNSEEYNGILLGKITPLKISGFLQSDKPKFLFFFWKKKKNVEMVRRIEFQIPTQNRYRYEVFHSYNLQKDIKYGKANGYWTETPYLDDPYIEILAKGMVNLFRGEKDLDLKLDLYQPVGDAHTLRPLVLLIHGGAFYIGNKQSPTEQIIADKLTKLGYVVASMDYRMGFKLKGEDIERSGYKAIQDAHAALRFLSSKSNEIGIDPTQIYVAGTSAGAMASLHIAFLDNDERPVSSFDSKKEINLGNIEESGNQLTNTFEIKAVTNLWGAVLDTSIIDPDERIPILSVHGNKDDIVPIDHSHPFKNTMLINRLIMDEIYGSQPIHERLNKMGIYNKLIVLDGMGHEPQLDNFKSINSTLNTIINEMTAFFYQQTVQTPVLTNTVFKVSSKEKLIAFELEEKDGELSYFEAEGGLKVSNSPNEKNIIWIDNFPHHQLTVYTRNRFDAWIKQTVKVEIQP